MVTKATATTTSRRRKEGAGEPSSSGHSIWHIQADSFVWSAKARKRESAKARKRESAKARKRESAKARKRESAKARKREKRESVALSALDLSRSTFRARPFALGPFALGPFALGPFALDLFALGPFAPRTFRARTFRARTFRAQPSIATAGTPAPNPVHHALDGFPGPLVRRAHGVAGVALHHVGFAPSRTLLGPMGICQELSADCDQIGLAPRPRPSRKPPGC